MGRKKNREINSNRPKKEEKEKGFFDDIVLKEKKEEPKKTQPKKVERSRKKSSEIVQGYNPSLSFADILYSFEKTGNPYSMPKSTAGKMEKEDFGAILDKWEGKGKTHSSAKNRAGQVKNEYKPTKSFGEILASFEGKSVERKPVAEKKPEKPEKKTEKKSNEFLKDEKTEDVQIAPNASWSILGGKNENFVRVEKTEKKEKKDEEVKSIKRVSKPYKPQNDFASILSAYEGKSVRNKVISTHDEEVVSKEKEPIKEEILSEAGFFRKEDEDNKIAKGVSWSILGGKNDEFVRPEPDVEKSNENTHYEVKSEYVPKKEFSQILNQYDQKSTSRPVCTGDGKKSKKDLNNTSIKAEDNKVKTFEEILKEKGDSAQTRPQITISKLRTMLPQATLDLHGETQLDAERLVKDFVLDCREHGLRKICIITGKGLHSENGSGVLRDATERVLDEMGVVSEKNNAPMNAGGSGALWIILKS